MSTQLGLGRLQHGVVGAIIAAATVVLFFLGGALRSCLPDRPELILLIVIELSIYRFIISIPAILAGFIIGFFVRFRLTAGMAALFTTLLLVVGLVIGYSLAGGSCVPA